jgi:hypothetical protein
MTSWERGRENEREGQREEREGMDRGDLGEQARGAAKDVGGKIEQGVNNVTDTLSGRQRDLEGNIHNYGTDVERGVRDAGRNVDQGLRDAGNAVEDAADRAGDWVRDRADNVDRKI